MHKQGHGGSYCEWFINIGGGLGKPEEGRDTYNVINLNTVQ